MPRKNNIISTVANVSRHQFQVQHQILSYVFQRQTEFRMIHFANNLPGKSNKKAKENLINVIIICSWLYLQIESICTSLKQSEEGLVQQNLTQLAPIINCVCM